jgi:uncharacterized protein
MPQYLSPGVYVEEVEAGSRPIEGVGTAVASFVGLAAQGPFNEPTLVTNWSQFTQTFGDFVGGSYLAHAVYGYFNNGGGAAFIVRIGQDGQAPAARGELMSGADGNIGAYRVIALEEGAAGNAITVETHSPQGDDAPDDIFTLQVKRADQVEETFEGLSSKKGKQNAATIVNAQSKLVRLEEIGNLAFADRRPAPGSVTLTGGAAQAPARVRPDDYVGDSADRTGFGGLEAVETVTMVSVPDLMAAYQAGMIDLEGVQAVHLGMIAHCELMGDRVAILDPPPGLNSQQIREWRVHKAGYDSKYATLYWPWIKVFDPLSGQAQFVPPSGHMAGVWGRSDDTRGVHKAPANEVVRGVLSLETSITKAEHDLLNPVGINVIRAFPGRGIRVWGARTLSSDPSWRYLNVRRLFNYIEGSILGGTQWVVFEPNDLDLWQRIRRTINAFLLRVWRDGALFGATPEQAFYVKCDAETNPPEVVDAGQVVVEIGICPVKPAEFVVFRLSQFSGGSDLVE